MSDNWIVKNIERALETWSEKLAEIWQLLTQSPQAFKGGAIWNVMQTVHGALQAIALALLVLFFAAGVVKTCGSFAELKKPEHALKLFVRFAIAKALITHGMELMLAILSIVQGVISTIMNAAGFGTPESITMPAEMVTIIEDLQREQTSLILNDLDKNNQSLLLCVLTVLITADTKEQLDRESNSLRSAARNRNCQMAVLKFQQLDGLNTVLPIGVRRLECFRSLVSRPASVLTPFRNVDILDPEGIYYGVNKDSRNPILIDRAMLMNQSAMIFGVSGSGKSLLAKMITALILMKTKDYVIICDPENEYENMVRAVTDNYAVVHLSVGGRDRLNAVMMVDGYGGSVNDSIATKAEFILSLMEQFSNDTFGSSEKSLVDRCLRSILENRDPHKPEPTLRDLRDKLMEQPEPEAKDLALALEIYTIGSLDIFGGASTVDLNKRVIIFDIHDLGDNLRPAAMLVMLDTIMNRVTQNWRNDIRTHVILDEFHRLLQFRKTAEYTDIIWRMLRKRNVFPTAITQNAASLLETDKGRSMVSNSELLVLLNQSQPDQIALGNLLGLSDEQLRAISNAQIGTGLIRRGPALIQFENRFPKDTELYNLMTTKPGEGVFGGVHK